MLTLLVLAIILTTQFSFGRAFATLFEHASEAIRRWWDAFTEWREERRKERQRREVIAKHARRAGAPPASVDAAQAALTAARAARTKTRAKPADEAEPEPPAREVPVRPAPAPAPAIAREKTEKTKITTPP